MGNGFVIYFAIPYILRIFAAEFYTDTTMTKLSVNINKVATIRNTRGEKMPDGQRSAMGSKGLCLKPACFGMGQFDK